MKTIRLFLAVSVLNLSSALLAKAQSPTASNVQAAQRPGTQLVDITYDLSDPDSATVAVLVAISTNGGASYTLPGTTFTGAVGNGVTPGVGKQITWNAGQDWPGQYSTDVRFKVVANDNNQPANPDAAKLVWIPPGTFQMGGSADYSDDEVPITQVTISKGFWLRKYEVTQEEYDNVVGSNPSWFPDDPQLPVESVSWQNAVDFCAALNAREGSAGRLPAGCQYSLPTEAEWEYACRAGTSTRFSFGDDPDCNTIANYAWYYDVSSLETHPVGQKLPNQWGLCDMHGNVWEWCLDWYSVGGYPGGSVTDPTGSTSGTDRVFRGGSFGNYCVSCRSANREYGGPSQSSRFIGFRVALVQVATGVSSESNVTTVDTRTSDLVAVALAWDNSTSGADFQYEVRSNALAMATAAKLLWASNTTAAAIISGVPEILSQPIPVGASGLSAVIPVPAANFANPPATATHVLLVLDPDNLVTESDEGNNVMVLPIGCRLNVPLLKQGGATAPWGNITYDHLPPVDGNGKPNRISRWGCYLTCCAMLVNYHAISQGVGFSTTPETLNTWLNGQNDGYDSAARVNPYAVQRYALANGVSMYYQGRLDQMSDSVVNNYICSGNPVLLKVPHGRGHFVLATGQTTVNATLTYLINDPGYQNSTLEGYGFSYTGIRKFSATPTTPQALLITGHSPIELLLIDASGNRTGYDPATGQTLREIPNSGYAVEAIADDDDQASADTTPEARELDIPAAGSGRYTLKVFGTGAGAFTVNFTGYHSSGSPAVAGVTGSARLGSFAAYELDYSATPGTELAVNLVQASPAIITGISPGTQGWTLSAVSVAGTTNRLWASANLSLSPASWAPIATSVAGTNGVCQFTDTNSIGQSYQFYRVSTP